MTETPKPPERPESPDDHDHGHVHGPGCSHDHGEPSERPIVRTGAKVGRNDPCPCGSGAKFKKCCGK